MNKIFAVLALFLMISALCNASSQEQRRMLETAAAGTASDNCLYVLFDGGSSSTKIRLYQWPCRKTSTIPDLRLIAPVGSDSGFRINSKLSAVTKTQDEMDKYFKPGFDYITNKLTELKLTVKPFVFLRATAGLRLVSPDDQKVILKLVRNTFRKNTNFVFLDDEWARVITGEEEGTFLWISVNYALKNIKSDNKSPIDLSQSAAVIDIGGASAQIAFADSTTNNKFLDLASKNRIKMYSETFLGYGNDEARNAILADNDRAYCFSTVENSDGTEYSYTANNAEVKFGGNFNFDKCVNAILRFLKIDGCTYPLTGGAKDCSAQSTYKKLTTQKTIYGVSSIYYAMNNIFGETSKTLTLAAFRAKSKEFCEKQLTKTQISDNSNLMNYCFQSIYVTTLLSDAFGLIDKEITVQSVLNEFALDWSIGSLVYDINSLQCDYLDLSVCTIPDEPAQQTITPNSSSILATTLFILLALFI